MKKIYTIKNIHCADCARSLEEAISNMKGVVSAKINFLTEKFEIEVNDVDFDTVFTKVKKLVRDFSRNVELFEEGGETETSNLAKIRFKLTGVNCQNCANNIISNVRKLKEVQNVEYNTALSELVVSTCEEVTQALKSRIKSLITTLDPQVKIKDQKEANSAKGFNLKLFLYCIGLIIAVPIFLVEYSIINLNVWLYYSLIILSAIALGYSTYLTAIRMLFRLNINENLLVSISVFGAMAIGEGAEGLMVVALYTLGKMLEAKAVNKSRKSIQALLDISPEFAVVIRDGEEQKVDPAEVKVGEIIIARPGEKVALDGKVVVGKCHINAQSLTGEAEPILKQTGDEVLSGIIVLDGVLEIETTAVLAESTTTKIMNLIENASENKSKTETFISKFSKYYTLLVVALAITVGVVTGFVLKDFNTAIYRALIFLVISCPCAFAISVPLTYFSGIGNASQNGILVKGSNYLDACAKTKVVAFDKTGTLTTGEFKIKEIKVLEPEVYTKEEILEIAGIGEQNSIHPLAKSILNALGDKKLPKPEKYQEIPGVGISFEYDGTEYFVGKSQEDVSLKTKVAVKKGNVILGEILFEDKVKNESSDLFVNLKQMGVKTAILSGDKAEVTQKLGVRLHADEVHAELLPQDKFNWLENKKNTLEKTEKLVYIGDGINDAPSLALADVGISMGINGSDASIEASDIVLVDDDPSKVVDAIKISKFTKKIVLQNIIFASIIKIACLILGTVGIAKMFMAVFADVGVTILAVLNSLRTLKYNTKKKRD